MCKNCRGPGFRILFGSFAFTLDFNPSILFARSFMTIVSVYLFLFRSFLFLLFPLRFLPSNRHIPALLFAQSIPFCSPLHRIYANLKRINVKTTMKFAFLFRQVTASPGQRQTNNKNAYIIWHCSTGHKQRRKKKDFSFLFRFGRRRLEASETARDWNAMRLLCKTKTWKIFV